MGSFHACGLIDDNDSYISYIMRTKNNVKFDFNDKYGNNWDLSDALPRWLVEDFEEELNTEWV